MRKRIFMGLCIAALLIISIVGMVACTPGSIEIPPPAGEVPDPGTPEIPPTLQQATIVFSAIEYTGDKYNGETGIANDTYLAKLKVNVSVEGVESCSATIAIQSVTISRKNIQGVVIEEPRPATTDELAKFTVAGGNTITGITTTPTEKIILIRFGDFSEQSKYAGAIFTFELQAEPFA